MGKQNKTAKRKDRLKAKKRKAELNLQVVADRLSAALAELCVSILPEYIDDRNGIDVVGRQIVYRFGVIAWNLAITGQKLNEEVDLPNSRFSAEERAMFRGEVIKLVERKISLFPKITTCIQDCSVRISNGIAIVKCRPGSTLPVNPENQWLKTLSPTTQSEVLTPERIRKIRLSRSLTQAKLGELLQVSSGTVSAWERGKASPRLEQQSALHRLESSLE